MEFRMEHDTMGQIKVPADRYWGAQTQRSLEHFKIGTEKMPVEIIYAFAVLKKSAALVNLKLGMLDELRAEAIAEVCDEILAGHLQENFPLAVWQTGSGTQTNMNVNEVIARRANERLGQNQINPNEHVPELQRHLSHRHAHCGQACAGARGAACRRSAGEYADTPFGGIRRHH